MTPLLWTERALKEYAILLEYLFENWGKTVMLRVSDDINQKVSHIHQYPEHYPIVIKTKIVRRCVAVPQISIYYKILRNEVYS